MVKQWSYTRILAVREVLAGLVTLQTRQGEPRLCLLNTYHRSVDNCHEDSTLRIGQLQIFDSDRGIQSTSTALTGRQVPAGVWASHLSIAFARSLRN